VFKHCPLFGYFVASQPVLFALAAAALLLSGCTVSVLTERTSLSFEADVAFRQNSWHVLARYRKSRCPKMPEWGIVESTEM
jgi:hypothetical protein